MIKKKSICLWRRFIIVCSFNVYLYISTSFYTPLRLFSSLSHSLHGMPSHISCLLSQSTLGCGGFNYTLDTLVEGSTKVSFLSFSTNEPALNAFKAQFSGSTLVIIGFGFMPETEPKLRCPPKALTIALCELVVRCRVAGYGRSVFIIRRLAIILSVI